MKSDFEVRGLKFDVGSSAASFNAAIRKAERDQLVGRIWNQDHTLWKPEPTEIFNRLGWLDVAERMQAEIPSLKKFVNEAQADGMDRTLLLGMGGSSLAPELFSYLFAGSSWQALSVLDSTDPDAVVEKENAHDPRRTLYIVSSKSGGTVETKSLFKYFYNKARATLGAKEVGNHFVAITDLGSGLAKTAEMHGFRHTFLADPNIGGRYSALSHFGLVPAALVGVDLHRLLSSAEGMAVLCKGNEVAQNPGAMLGLFFGTLAMEGHDKATFLFPEDKATFGDWLEQLIAESTGKEGKGILPIIREPQLSEIGNENDRVFITLQEPGRSPHAKVEWASDYDIGAQFFLWEFATAVAGYVLGINPFDQPNVEAAKAQTRVIVEEYRLSGELSQSDIKKLGWTTVEDFTNQGKPGDYIALQVYAKPSAKTTEALQRLRVKLGNFTGLPTTIGYGPRFLHSTGQLHKGDGGNGLFIQLITPPPKDDIPIPEKAGQTASDITFGVLKVSQALGDAQALRQTGRRVISFEIEEDPTDALNALTSDIGS